MQYFYINVNADYIHGSTMTLTLTGLPSPKYSSMYYWTAFRDKESREMLLMNNSVKLIMCIPLYCSLGVRHFFFWSQSSWWWCCFSTLVHRQVDHCAGNLRKIRNNVCCKRVYLVHAGFQVYPRQQMLIWVYCLPLIATAHSWSTHLKVNSTASIFTWPSMVYLYISAALWTEASRR